jgi:hypothetical protein
MFKMDDITNTLFLILGLGLILVLLNGRLRWTMEGFDNPVSCGVDAPCEVGLKCINGFCAKTERLRMYEKDADNQAESSGPMPLY